MTRHIDVAGCQLAYDLRGSGPRLLFIQGVGVQGDGWLPQIDAMASSYACLSFDNRGMGRSLPVGDAVTVPRMAEDAFAVMQAESWPDAHVIGHSLGGLVALHLALAHPTAVKSLALLCTFAGGRDAAPPSVRMMWLGLRSRVGTRAMRRRGFLHLVLPPAALRAADADALARQLGDLFGHDIADQPAIVSAQLRAMREADATPRLGELAHIPSLVVTAKHDPIAPPASGRTLAASLPGARYVEYEDASHGLPIQHAARVNALLDEHLRTAGLHVATAGRA